MRINEEKQQAEAIQREAALKLHNEQLKAAKLIEEEVKQKAEVLAKENKIKEEALVEQARIEQARIASSIPVINVQVIAIHFYCMILKETSFGSVEAMHEYTQLTDNIKVSSFKYLIR